MMAQRVDGDIQILFAVQLGDRMEMIGFESSSSDEDDTKIECVAIIEQWFVPLVAIE